MRSIWKIMRGPTLLAVIVAETEREAQAWAYGRDYKFDRVERFEDRSDVPIHVIADIERERD
jgi:hypothetical protein